MVVNILVLIIKVRKKERGCFYGVMVVSIKESSEIMLLMGLESINGVMEGSSKGIG